MKKAPPVMLSMASYLGAAAGFAAEHVDRRCGVVVGPTPHDPQRVEKAQAKRARRAAKRLAVAK